MKSHPHKPVANATAYSYLRFSSPEQAKGDSLRRQTGMRDEWCTKHGVKLDTSLNMTDAGVSAFTGDHRANPDRHALAGFLELVRVGKVARGSYFIIENLDRLTREDSVPAVNLFTGILLSGIRIVQLDPETIYTDKSDSMDVMRAVLEMSRGHSESANKSRRMGAVWGEKRKRAAEGKAVMSRSCPAWLKVEGKGTAAKYVLIPQRAEVVRRVFQMATDGSGVRAIVKALVADAVPPFGRKPWNPSYVKVMLKNRAAFGEFTPRTGRGSSQKRKPTGSPIEGYYPAAVTADQFFAAQVATAGRKGKAGRPGKEHVNVFAGLLWDARSRGRLHLLQYSRDGVKSRYLAPYATEAGAKHIGFPLAVFEDALFSYLDGIDTREIMPATEAGADETVTLAARRADVEQRLARTKARLRSEDEAETLLDYVRELEVELKAVGEKLNEAKQRTAAPVSEAWGEFQSIREALKSAPDPDAARLKLRAVLRRMLESVWCLFMPEGKGPRVAWVQVVFAGGAKFQNFAIVYRPRHGLTGGKEYPAAVRVLQLADIEARGAFDVRNENDARDLEELLAKVEPAALDAVVPTRNERVKRGRAHAERAEAASERNEEWRRMRDRGETYEAIATAAGVSTNTVHAALNGRKRK